MNRNSSLHTRSTFVRRRAIPALLGGLLSLCVCTDVLAIAEDDVPSGRLGYTWVPDPPSQPRSDAEAMGLQIAKYGGAGLVGLWILSKMFGGE